MFCIWMVLIMIQVDINTHFVHKNTKQIKQLTHQVMEN